MIKLLLILLIGLVFEAAGVVFLKKGITQVGEMKQISAAEVFRVVKAGVTNPSILSGVFFEALFFVCLLVLLAESDISFLWPLTALSFVLTTFAAMLFLLLALCPSVWAKRDPTVDWRQTGTEHFLLIYPADTAAVAGDAAQVTEAAYPKVKTLFGFAPDGRTPLVLNSLRDDANGYSQGIYTKMEF